MSDLKKLIDGLPIYEGNVASFTVEPGDVRLLHESVVMIPKWRWDALMDEAEQKPSWEPGTLICRDDNESHILRLEWFVKHEHLEAAYECWEATWFNRPSDGPLTTHIPVNEYKVHRLPHEFKVGDWFECSIPYCKGKAFQVDRISGHAIRSRLDSLGTCGDWHPISQCRHAPPKESQAVETSEDQFQGPHWRIIHDPSVDIRSAAWLTALMCCLEDLSREFTRRKQK